MNCIATDYNGAPHVVSGNEWENAFWKMKSYVDKLFPNGKVLDQSIDDADVFGRYPIPNPVIDERDMFPCRSEEKRIHRVAKLIVQVGSGIMFTEEQKTQYEELKDICRLSDYPVHCDSEVWFDDEIVVIVYVPYADVCETEIVLS